MKPLSATARHFFLRSCRCWMWLGSYLTHSSARPARLLWATHLTGAAAPIQTFGASVNLLTRTPSKHKDVDGSLDELDRFDYDILINCTPSPMPVNKDHIQPGKIVMDITNKPKNTEFLVHAKANQCQIIYGYQMFVNQAVEQFRLWFGDTFDNEQAKAVLIAKCEEVL